MISGLKSMKRDSRMVARDRSIDRSIRFFFFTFVVRVKDERLSVLDPFPWRELWMKSDTILDPKVGVKRAWKTFVTSRCEFITGNDK